MLVGRSPPDPRWSARWRCTGKSMCRTGPMWTSTRSMCRRPGLAWDFRVPRVASINASGHKHGLVYPGVGWAVWRDSQALPEDLVFKVNYLGGQMPTFALNFSRSGAPIAAQYYNFLRLGSEGYRRVQQAC